MKAYDLARITVINAVVLVLIWAVYQDFQGRLAYFQKLGFTPSTTYYPFFYITSAVNGSTQIQGLLTLDWIQVLAVVLAVIDALFVVGLLRNRKATKATDGTNGPNL